jgi:error-prone DNA polymerase
VFADYQTAGLSLRAHPISFYREQLDRLNAVPSSQLKHLQHRRRVCVAGLVILRQRPSTAKGITFVTLEDETGTANLVVHQGTWERFYRIARRSPAWLAFGHVERKNEIIHVVVQRLEDLPTRLAELGPAISADRRCKISELRKTMNTGRNVARRMSNRQF